MLATGSQQGTLFLYSIPSGDLVAKLSDHQDSIVSMDFSPDGKLLATGSRDGNIHLYRVSGHTCAKLLSFPSHKAIRQLRFHPNDHRLVFTVDQDIGVRVWDLDRLQTKLAKMSIDDGKWPTPLAGHKSARPKLDRDVAYRSRIWHDINGNGKREKNEPGIKGAVVELFSTFDKKTGNKDDKLLATVNSDSQGHFSLKTTVRKYHLFYLAIRLPTGYAFSGKPGEVNRLGYSEPCEADITNVNMKRGISVLSALTAVADTNLDSAHPDKTFAGDGVLATRERPGMYSLLQFDISRIKAPITKARLRLRWHTSERLCQGVAAFRFLKPWKESSATWNNVNDGADPIAATSGGDLDPRAVDSPPPISSPRNGPVAEWDVTAAVKEWQSGVLANNGLLLRSAGDSGRLDFWSREGAKNSATLAPQLILSVDQSKSVSEGNE